MALILLLLITTNCVKNISNLRIKEKGLTSGARLIRAVNKGNIDEVIEVLDEEVDINYLSTKKKTALIYASEKGHKEIVKLLIDNGADIDYNIEVVFGRTALMCASSNGHKEIVEL